MLNFSSALYLGMNHPSWSLSPWKRLTSGVPSALEPGDRELAAERRLARLQGSERAVVAPSTLHVFWDLCSLLARSKIVLLHEIGLYAIGRWGVERAEGLGVPTRAFKRGDMRSLRRMLNQTALSKLRPVVVCDGLNPATGCINSIGQYAEVVRPLDGLVVVDDTQALGILGREPNTTMSYGIGGGGSLRYHQLIGPSVVLVCSLAKGFGVPMAALSGSADLVGWFVRNSQTRVHCSPSSIAALRALENALDVNDRCGDKLRVTLVRRVRQFQRGLKESGLTTAGSLFPVQTLNQVPGLNMVELFHRLSAKKLRTVLNYHPTNRKKTVTFLLRANHTEAEIAAAIDAIGESVGYVKHNFKQGVNNEMLY